LPLYRNCRSTVPTASEEFPTAAPADYYWELVAANDDGHSYVWWRWTMARAIDSSGVAVGGGLPVTIAHSDVVTVSPFPDWTVVSNPAAATRFAKALQSFDAKAEFVVGNVVPAGFPAHARIVHPAYLGDTATPERVQLRHIAAPETHSWVGDDRFIWQTQWPAGSPADYATPTCSTPDMDDLDVLVELLSNHTSTKDDTFALVWPGWGHDESDRLWENAPLTAVGRERFALLRGPLSAIPTLGRQLTFAPSYWWPQDQSWTVGTDIDDFSTYVSGDDRCIAALIASERIEARRAKPDNPVFARPYYE
jgi:hypothetical protein